MLQVLLPMIMVIFTGIIAYLTIMFAVSTKTYLGLGGLLGLDLLIDVTSARASYFMFIVQAAILISCAVCAFKISNHNIISLDILYFISLLMLIRFHNLKEAGNLSNR